VSEANTVTKMTLGWTISTVFAVALSGFYAATYKSRTALRWCSAYYVANVLGALYAWKKVMKIGPHAKEVRRQYDCLLQLYSILNDI
jgi:hypothetical protein